MRSSFSKWRCADAADRRRPAAADVLKLQAADLGFDPSQTLVGFVNPPRAGGYDTMAKHRAFGDRDRARERAPGVRRAALASVLPLSGDGDMSFQIEGRAAPATPSQTPVRGTRLVRQATST